MARTRGGPNPSRHIVNGVYGPRTAPWSPVAHPGLQLAPLRPAARVGLYGALLGDRTGELAPQITALHASHGCTRASGVLSVTRGGHPLARLLAVLLRLPPAGEAVPIGLEIARHGTQERWWRRFGDARVLTSCQMASGCGALLERYGLLELRFDVAVAHRALELHSTGARVAVRGLGVALPGWLLPQVRAVVAPSGPRAACVHVRVEVPVAGLLLAYEGTIEEDDRG